MASAIDITSFIYSHEQSQHVLSPTHPMRPIRLMHMHELMRSVGLLDADNVVNESPRLATDDEIAIFHDTDYIDVVKAIDAGAIVPGMNQFGFGPGDNPPRPGMYRHAALAAGGAMLAAERILSGQTKNAFAPAGGMHHHAMHDRASGFGIFNDAVIAIKHLNAQGLRVFYVDIDVHHGDGVQAGLYETDRTMTVSIHESGQWLFPGTGGPNETGIGEGEGYSVNIPLAPYTDDQSMAPSLRRHHPRSRQSVRTRPHLHATRNRHPPQRPPRPPIPHNPRPQPSRPEIRRPRKRTRLPMDRSRRRRLRHDSRSQSMDDGPRNHGQPRTP